MIRRLDHVGIVVDDLEEARSFMSLLGLEWSHDVTFPDRLKAAFYRCGDAAIELIEISDPSERARRLGQVTARVEHVAVEVEDLALTADRLRDVGVAMTAREPLVVGSTRSYWTEPESCDGVMYQLIEKDQTV